MDFSTLSNYERKDFEALSIHDLRILGRGLGVEAPTMKSKKELIDAVLETIAKNKGGSSSLVGSSVNKSSKGRPPKKHIPFTFNDVASDSQMPVTAQASVGREDKPSEVKILDGITTDIADAFSQETPAPEKRRGRPAAHANEYVKKNNYQAQNGNGNYSGYNNGSNANAYNGSQGNYNGNNGQGGYQGNYNNGNQNNYNNGYVNNVANGIRRKRDVNIEAQNEEEGVEAALEIKEGVLEIMADGYGFLRATNYESGANDAYVSAQKIKRSGLRKGDKIKAEARQTCENRPAGVVNILEVNGAAPETAFGRPHFDALTPIYPDVRYKLEIPGKNNDFAIRSIDMVAPIGKGQRGMIVSPPKAGKTVLLKKIAHSITENYPDAHLIVLLIDERPEEVTDMQRSIEGEVVFSTFDEMPEHHTKAAELVLERAKRLVERGEDVIILMDSLTRLARAYNLTISPTGRTLSGGIDPGALHSPKRFFGAARNIENGGSLTIIATALVDTGSRMDDVIYEEFKGTGNMEIHLDRRLSEKRIFPAIDLYKSGTRREDLLLDQNELQGIWAMRKMLSAGGEGADATENLIGMMVKTKTNKEFLEQLNLSIISMQKQGYMI